MNNPFEVQSRTGWESRCLGELLRIKHGFAFQSKYFTEEGDFILLTPGNFFEEGGFRPKNGQEKYYSGTVPAEYLLSCGDLVVVMTEQADGLLGSSALIPESGRYLHNQRIGLIVDLNEKHVDKPFLYHLFNSKLVRRQIAATASGTKVRHTSPSRIYDVVVMMPPMAEQRYIADVLTTWDRAIDLTARLITAKQQRKRGLMQQLLTGRRRFQRFVVSDEVQHTDIGPLPADWRYVSIGEVAGHVSERNAAGRDLPVLSCTKYDGLVDSLAYFGRRIFSDDTSTYKIVRRGQFAYATNHIEEGSIGYQDLHDEALISPMYTVFEADRAVNHRFLYALLKTETYRQRFERSTSASVDRRGSLRWPEFSRIKIPLPSLAEQAAIANVLECADRELALLDRKLALLKRQKRGLMQQLLSGKVRVPA